jgi:uncharacterized repeat protein (TIGR01451 family)
MKKSTSRIASFLSLLMLTQMVCSCGTTVTLTALVYEDLNGNGQKESNEPWMEDVFVTWLGRTQTTNENGEAQFSSQSFTTETDCLSSGVIYIQVPSGYVLTQTSYINPFCDTTMLFGIEFFENAEQLIRPIFGVAPIQEEEPQLQIVPTPTEEPVLANPALTLTKTVDHTTCVRAGEQFNYTYVFTNTGDVPLTGPFTLADNKIPSLNCEQDLSTLVLQPNESATCTGIYFSTDVESEIGAVIRNEAVVSVVYMEQVVTSNTAVQEVFCTANPRNDDDDDVEPTQDPCAGGPPYPETCTNPPTPED